MFENISKSNLKVIVHSKKTHYLYPYNEARLFYAGRGKGLGQGVATSVSKGIYTYPQTVKITFGPAIPTRLALSKG